ALVLTPSTGPAAPGEITTVAGGPGEGPGTSVGQSLLYVAVRGSAVYVSDREVCVIRRLDTTTGTETVVAGTGFCDFGGDGGPATAAQLDAPGGVTLDDAGNLFIADTLNNRIRRVDGTTGIITTVAGSGYAGFLDVDSYYGGDGGPATAALLYEPSG